MSRWGIVATVKAPRDQVLDFAAYHLRAGAQRLFLYLDAPDAALAGELSRHHAVDVTQCDAAYWERRKGRPPKHQVRQVRNAQHAYTRARDLDWLAHIDVDEFLWSAPPIDTCLDALPETSLCARVRPIEALAGSDGLFKAFHADHAERTRAARRLYPNFGHYLRGGFLSHIAGKLFVRTGVEGLKIRIHNARLGEEQNPGEMTLREMDLCHVHAASWESWHAQFAYRHAKGSYRPELKGRTALTPHALLAGILERDGAAGLRAFFEETCAATPRHIALLEAEGLLRHRPLALAQARADIFGR